MIDIDLKIILQTVLSGSRHIRTFKQNDTIVMAGRNLAYLDLINIGKMIEGERHTILDVDR